VQIVVLDSVVFPIVSILAFRLHHFTLFQVDDAVEYYMSLVLSQGLCRIDLAALRATVTPKLIYGSLTATEGAKRIHCHRFQATFDAHLVTHDELLQFASIIEHILSAGRVDLTCSLLI
jgi:hypothetical protein